MESLMWKYQKLLPSSRPARNGFDGEYFELRNYPLQAGGLLMPSSKGPIATAEKQRKLSDIRISDQRLQKTKRLPDIVRNSQSLTASRQRRGTPDLNSRRREIDVAENHSVNEECQ